MTRFEGESDGEDVEIEVFEREPNKKFDREELRKCFPFCEISFGLVST